MILLLSKSAFCQENVSPQKLKDFVFAVPQLDLVKQLPDFKQSLKQIKGLEFHGFCESQQNAVYDYGKETSIFSVGRAGM